jgi:short chain dehydrogenase
MIGAAHGSESDPDRRMMRLALPHMKGPLDASVINVASISGWSPQLAMSGLYGAAKAALIFDTERWALEFVPPGRRMAHGQDPRMRRRRGRGAYSTVRS